MLPRNKTVGMCWPNDLVLQEGLVRAAENCTEADLSTLSVVNALKMVLLNQVGPKLQLRPG